MSLPSELLPVGLLGTGAAAEGYSIERSVRFNSADSAYLSRTPASAGNRKTWTWAGWVKIADVTAQQTIFAAAVDGSNRVWLRFNSGPLEFQFEEGGAQTNLYTNAVYRDPSAWYHIVVAVDTTQATASNRSKIYVNGVQVTSFSSEQYPAQNYETYVNAANLHRIGCTAWSLAVFADSYMADIHLIDGQTPGTDIDDANGSVTGIPNAEYLTDFGEFDTNGIWQPKAYTFGANPNDGTTWSNTTSASLASYDGVTGIFDGSLSTRGGTTSTNNNYNTLFSGASISCTSGVRIYWNGVGAGQRYIRINDTVEIDNGSAQLTPGWTSLGIFSGTINKLEVKTAAINSWAISAIEIDGYILIDGTIDNSFHLDFSDNSTAAALGTDTSGAGNNWSVNNISVTEGDGNYITGQFSGDVRPITDAYGPRNMFNGITGSESTSGAICFATFTSNSTCTWTAPTTFTGLTSLRLYVDLSGSVGKLSVNGTDYSSLVTALSGGDGWITIPESSLSTIVFGYTGGTSSATGIAAVEVNGSILLDNYLSAGNDSLVDVPTNGTETDTGIGGQVRGNYATLNPLDNTATLSNGNLDFAASTSTSSTATIQIPSSGKWYFEATVTTQTSSTVGFGVGISPDNNRNNSIIFNGSSTIKTEEQTVETAYQSNPFYAGDVIGVIVDADSNSVSFELNNSALGPSHEYTYSGLQFPFVRGTGGATASINFGQRPFAYTAPSGFKALCTANLDAPLVTKPSEYMDVKLYTGNGTSQTISGLEFSPDLVWMKVRSIDYNHTLIDSVRGATKTLSSSMTVQEYTEPTGPTAFTSDGWSMSGDVTYVGSVNANGQTYAGWCWDAGHPATASTGGVRLDGSGDYLSVADSADFDLAGNDFTIEAWVYHSSTDYGSYEGIIAQWVDTSGRSFVLETVGAGASSDLEFYYYDTSNNFVGPVQGGTLSKCKWHHVAVCRSGSTIYMFVDGVMYGSGTPINVNIKNGTNNLTIGGNVVGGGYWNGFISNARIVNGTALYTSNFTPPSTELTNVTNTKLLCCQSTTSAAAAAVSPGAITANGNATATTYNPLDAFSVDGTGYSTASAAGITEGTIPLTGASVNRSAGFSIVTYTGTLSGTPGTAPTVGHGLGVKPALIISKSRNPNGDDGGNWYVNHTYNYDNWFRLNTTNAGQSIAASGGGTTADPTSSVFSTYFIVGSNCNNNNYVAYCFAPVEGYSAFGSYTGNGLPDGPFIYTGFRPRWILIKVTSGTIASWRIFDTERDTYNLVTKKLYPNLTNEELDNGLENFDIVSNGFKFRSDDSGVNHSGATYIYYAVAESPFQYARGR